MIIKRLEVSGLRKLAQGAWDFSPGLNVIRGNNEAGKSTLQQALLAALFADPDSAPLKRDRKLASWGREENFACSVVLEIGGQDFRLERDANTGLVRLTQFAGADGEPGVQWEGKRRVKDRLDELCGLGSESAYVATACLRQQELARLQAGAEVKQLLQQTLTGGADDGNAEVVLKDLDRELRELVRPRARDGLLDRAEADLAATAEQLAQVVQPSVQRVVAARTLLQEAEAGLAGRQQELEVELEVLRRADRRHQLALDHQKLDDDCGRLARLVEEAQTLARQVADLRQELSDGVQIAGEDRERVQQWTRDVAREEDAAAQAEARAVRLQLELSTAETDHAALKARLPEVEDQRLVQQLAAEEAILAERLQESTRQVEDLRAAALRSQRLRGVGLGVAGGLLLVAGLFAYVGAAVASWGWIAGGIIGVGALAALVVALRRPAQDWRAADTELSALVRGLETTRARLREVLSKHACTELEPFRNLLLDLQEKLEHSRERRARLQAEVQAAGEAARLHRETGETLQRQLQDRLQATGLEKPEELIARALEQERLRQELGQREERLKGLLGESELDTLREQLRGLNLQRQARSDELSAPEMAAATLDAVEHERLRRRVEDLKVETEGLRQQQLRARLTLEESPYDVEDEQKLRAEQDDLVERVERLRRHRRALELAREVLQQARSEATTSALDLLAPRLDEYLQRLTNGRYGHTAADPDTLAIAVHSVEKGGLVDPDEDLSLATREQVYLSTRLALAELLWPVSAPPVLLDDPMVNFDEQRRTAALSVLSDLARERQIMLFTCSEAYDQAADRVIALQ